MRDAVICAAVRTPVGKRNGGLAGVHPVDLSAHVLEALAERTGLDPGLVDDVVWGTVMQTGEQAVNVGRNAVLAAGWPESVPGVTLDRQCGSSQQALHFAAAGVIAGHYDVAVAGGAESMTRVPMGVTMTQGPGIPFGPKMLARYDNGLVPQGISAELIAERWGITRTQVDELALASHEKAAAAIDDGRFEGQIAPVPLPDGTTFSTDEGVRRGGTLTSLGQLKTAFKPDGVVTAANSSQISDGAAALLVTTSERARELGLTPLVRVRTAVLAGADPITMLTAPIPATRKALQRSGLRLDEIGAVEINEAFATVVLAWQAELQPDSKVVNPNGGAIALGHPLGGSGARIMTTLVHHMVDSGIRYGLQTMCEGGGLANATILELRLVPSRALRFRLFATALVVLCLMGWFGGVDWGPRLALGLVAAYAVVRLGMASFRPLAHAERAGPAVDVVEPEGAIPVYACTGCGTQLVLLRKGNDRPPRHCGEPMTYSLVPADTVAVPDYPPDDLLG